MDGEGETCGERGQEEGGKGKGAKTESTYVIIESTLQFDDVEVIPGLLPLLLTFQRTRMRSRERCGRRPGNEAREMQFSPIATVPEVNKVVEHLHF